MSAHVRRRGRRRPTLSRTTIEREAAALAHQARGCTCDLTIDVTHAQGTTVAVLHHEHDCPALEAEGAIYIGPEAT